MEELRLPGLEEALGRVEVALGEATAADDRFLSEVAAHLASAGGKRLRPALLIASSQAAARQAAATTRVTDEAIRGGVAVELVHLGSLYHDDVMDEATNRRGVASVNAKWGNLVAILAGDFLLARASEIAASLGTEVAALLARTIGRLCEGEVGQLRYAFDVDRPADAYRSSIAGKTASLMSTAARIGALVADAPRPWVDALTEYGESLGMAFQIWDDVRDVICSDDTLGKPAGHDMVEGTYTLPVILALGVKGVGEDLRAILGAPLDAPAREKARDLVISSGAIEVAVAEARQWATKADEALDPVRAAAGTPTAAAGTGAAGAAAAHTAAAHTAAGDTSGAAPRLERLRMLGGVGHWLLDQLDLP